jgi:uncharacterized membrane protein (UPF0127 family)
LLCLLAFTGCDTRPYARILAPGGRVLATINLEIADTEQKREFGLMKRKSLPSDDGMLFVMPAATQLVFWMKDTEIPLDMIFIGADQKVTGVIVNTTPYSEDRLTVPGTVSKYAIEVNAGFAAAHRISPGDHVDFLNFLPVPRN